MEAMEFAEGAVKEFLLFRGFTLTLQALESELHSDVASGFQKGRTDRVLDFFQQYGEGLLRSGDPDWRAWFALPYMSHPSSDPNFQVYFSAEWLETLELSLRKFLCEIFEGIRLPALLKFGSEESKCVALEKELEQMREVLKAKDDEIAYLRKDSPRLGSPRFKKVVPDYRVSPPTTPAKPKSPLAPEIRSKKEDEADHEAAGKEDSNPVSTPGDFGMGKSPERASSAKWRSESRKVSRTRSTYSGGSEPERIHIEVSDAAHSREKTGDVSQVAVQYQETFSGHTSPITRCRYSATGANIASASVDGTVRIWAPDVAAASSRNATICTGAEVLSLEWEHRTDRLLLLGTTERNIKAWNVEAKRVVCDLTTEAMFPRVLDLKCSPTDSVFCCASASEITPSGEGVDGLGYGSLTIWNMRTWKAMTSLQLGQEPPVMTSVCFNHDGKLLAAGATDGKILIFDLRGNLPITGWPAHPGCAVSCVRFGHDQNSVFSLGADGKVFEWSLHNRGQILHLGNASSYCALASGILPRHEFAIDSGGRHVLLTSNTTSAPLYPWGSSMTQTSLEHKAAITSVDWHPSSPMFLTGSADHSVRVTAVG